MTICIRRDAFSPTRRGQLHGSIKDARSDIVHDVSAYRCLSTLKVDIDKGGGAVVYLERGARGGFKSGSRGGKSEVARRQWDLRNSEGVGDSRQQDCGIRLIFDIQSHARKRPFFGIHPECHPSGRAVIFEWTQVTRGNLVVLFCDHAPGISAFY